MRYFDWIDQYQKGKLSSSDEQAFEHEIQENAKLQAELDVFDLTDELLSAAAPVSTTVGSKTTIKKLPIWKAIALLSGIIFLGLFIWKQVPISNTQEVDSHPPTSEELLLEPGISPEKKKLPPQTSKPVAAVDSNRPLNPTSSSHISQKIESTSTSLTKSIALQEDGESKESGSRNSSNSRAIASIQPEVESQKIQLYTAQAVIDSTLTSSQEIALTATESITLKPGFHAKPGTNFRAKVNAGPLFRDKTVPN